MQAALTASGKSQADLARATGAKSSSVANWLGGRTKNLRGANLVIVSQLLNVSEAWLGAGIGPRERTSAGLWPFLNISPAQWEGLPAELREQAESYVAFLCEKNKSSGEPAHSLKKSTAVPLTEIGTKLKETKTRLRHNVTKDFKIDVLETQIGPLRKRAARSRGSR